MKQRLFKWGIFLVAAGGLLLLAAYYPLLQTRLSWLQARPLAGAFTLTEAPQLSVPAWFSGDFQQQTAQALKENPEIRPLFVRLKNEWLFRIFHAESHPVLEIGRRGYLFDKTYIHAALGLDYQGDAFIEQQVQQLSRLHAYLQQRGKQLLLLMPPPKAAHIPENLPAAYAAFEPGLSNRRALAAACRQQQIPFMDFSFLRKLEKQQGWPMYPPTGLHWSHYGATLAADSMTRYMEQLLHIRMPRMQVDSLLITNEIRPPDNEFGELLNLLRPYPYDSLAYPLLSFHTDSATTRPRVLILGDSYYRLLYDLGFQQQLFHPASRYWHYFEQHISPEHEGGASIDKSPAALQRVLEDTDLVLYVASATNLHRMGFGFTEAVLEWAGE
ncbi:MAG: hypothetical protein D6730_23640 [Bacteroidetes bacterium]|nr:MAG: hypothetical protein D6730_23640 [Bacteroidota bacterium]